MKTEIPLACLLSLAVLIDGCTSDDPVVSGQRTLGSIDATTYVAIGNSITAGIQSSALYQSGQLYSFANLLARRLETPFEQPLIPDPGTGRLITIVSLSPPVFEIGPPRISLASNASYAKPYNNLGIPGAFLRDALDSMGLVQKFLLTRNPFYQIVLRDQQKYGASVIAQAIRLNPTFVTFWLGNNDVLYYAISGGTDPVAPTDQREFDETYGTCLNRLRSALPGAKILVATIPDVRSVPFFRALTDQVEATLASVQADFRYQRHGERGRGTGSHNFALGLTSRPFITLEAMEYTALIGTPTGRWYSDYSRPVPGQIDTTKPFGLDPLNPFPDALVLDIEEQQTARRAVEEMNASIFSNASRFGAVVVDIKTRLEEIDRDGYWFAGEHLTTEFLSGGIYSLDGIHPSSKGAGMVANEFIKVMNTTFGANIPLVDITRIPGIPVPLGKRGERRFPVWNGIPAPVDGSGFPFFP